MTRWMKRPHQCRALLGVRFQEKMRTVENMNLHVVQLSRVGQDFFHLEEYAPSRARVDTSRRVARSLGSGG